MGPLTSQSNTYKSTKNFNSYMARNIVVVLWPLSLIKFTKYFSLPGTSCWVGLAGGRSWGALESRELSNTMEVVDMASGCVRADI